MRAAVALLDLDPLHAADGLAVAHDDLRVLRLRRRRRGGRRRGGRSWSCVGVGVGLRRAWWRCRRRRRRDAGRRTRSTRTTSVRDDGEDARGAAHARKPSWTRRAGRRRLSTLASSSSSSAPSSRGVARDRVGRGQLVRGVRAGGDRERRARRRRARRRCRAGCRRSAASARAATARRPRRAARRRAIAGSSARDSWSEPKPPCPRGEEAADPGGARACGARDRLVVAGDEAEDRVLARGQARRAARAIPGATKRDRSSRAQPRVGLAGGDPHVVGALVDALRRRRRPSGA